MLIGFAALTWITSIPLDKRVNFSKKNRSALLARPLTNALCPALFEKRMDRGVAILSDRIKNEVLAFERI
jgi:cobalamin synthase